MIRLILFGLLMNCCITYCLSSSFFRATQITSFYIICLFFY